MVKISFILGFVACAVARNSVLTEAVDTGSASNDTSATIGDGSALNNTSVAATVAPTTALNDSSASVDTDVATVAPASTTATPASTTAAPDVVSASTDSSASDAADVGALNSTSSSTEAPTTTPTSTAAVVNSTNVSTEVNSTAAPAATVKTGPSPISGQVTLVPGYGDCGGYGFNYTVYMPEDPAVSEYTMLTCETGYRCQQAEGSDAYRCKEWPSREPVSFYGQCGGGNYDGQTFCAPGAVCKYISASFSQCLPTY
ncbi:hypothetical protein PHYPSEUDO_007176 [Phytophthora pseudosyringae]|uniref:CBM1 domain-containing protein n=1 Tax=Phytophthora pseudosyringae TaxID=221518 RepID=A0A8T1VM47_9STRA|nr:hypothetical protein PHYPSEUDO_007176 [Phytophthora pseudosyringae]